MMLFNYLCKCFLDSKYLTWTLKLQWNIFFVFNNYCVQNCFKIHFESLMQCMKESFWFFIQRSVNARSIFSCSHFFQKTNEIFAQKFSFVFGRIKKEIFPLRGVFMTFELQVLTVIDCPEIAGAKGLTVIDFPILRVLKHP